MEDLDYDYCCNCKEKAVKELLIETELPNCQKCHDETIQTMLEYYDTKSLYPDHSEIIEGKLYLGDTDTSKSEHILEAYKITHILVAAAYLRQHFPDKFVYLQVPFHDTQQCQIIQYLDRCIEFIEQGKVVYVHCAAGIHRSAAVVVAYLVKTQNMTVDQAYDFVKKKRNCIRKQENFYNQLLEWESKLKKIEQK